MINLEIFKSAVMDSRDGITIADFSLPDNPLVFVNPAFERMTGYLFEEINGKNCRYLQGSDKEQEDQLNIIREAINNKESCVVTLRNYRKDGSMFWNELSISPIFNSEGQLTHYMGSQRDITSKVLMEQQILGENNVLKQSNTMLEYLVNIDPLTGIYNRKYLEEQLRIQWQIGLREKHLLSLFMIDIDYFKKYNDLYGHQLGDEALKSVAKILNSSFLRTTDFVARYGGEEFIILAIGGDQKQIPNFAESIVKKISGLQMPHKASDSGYITLSLGYSSCRPEPGQDIKDIIKQADEALYQAKGAGRNRAIGYSQLATFI